ncbi:MAG: hypothetical protein ACI8TL_001320 [Natronomonas sp.]
MGDWFEDDARDLVRMVREGLLDRVEVVDEPSRLLSTGITPGARWFHPDPKG